MRSNAALFRAMNRETDLMIAAVMPKLAEAEPVIEREPIASTLRVSIAEISGTRLYGFRRVTEVQ